MGRGREGKPPHQAPKGPGLGFGVIEEARTRRKGPKTLGLLLPVVDLILSLSPRLPNPGALPQST